MKIASAKKSLADKLTKESTENIDETKLVEINSTVWNSVENKCTLYIALFSISFTINVGIGIYFLYFHWYLKKRCYSC